MMSYKDRLYKSFLDKAKLKHDNKFDYSLVEYVNSKTNIKIICPIHGEFEQTPESHLKNHGCSKCFYDTLSIDRKKPTDNFINQSTLIYGGKYDYSLVDYVNNRTKVKIICPIHGEFEQTPYSHLNNKYGCSKCSVDINKSKKSMDVDEFINESNLIHNNKYDYSLVEYVNAKTNVTLRCSVHGEFDLIPDNHLRKKYGCPKCSKTGVSGAEKELVKFIKSLKIKLIEGDRKVLNNLELDVYIPSKNIAFEFDGLYWHSEKFKDKNYHLNKTELCENKDIKLIHVFEDEWFDKKDIVKSRIKNILGLTGNKIYARNCEIKEVSPSESKLFLNNNHIQGAINSKIKVGLYYKNELVSLMTFGSLRKNLNQSKKDDVYELLRFCNKLNTTVIGGADKLLKYFIKMYNPKEIISYADRRWSQGDLYNKLGFDFMHNSEPNYYYVINNKRENRFNYRKDILIKEGFDKELSEHKIMLSRGIYRIYDCGSKKYNLKLD